MIEAQERDPWRAQRNSVTIRALRHYAGVCMGKATDPALFTGIQVDYQHEAELALQEANRLDEEMGHPYSEQTTENVRSLAEARERRRM